MVAGPKLQVVKILAIVAVAAVLVAAVASPMPYRPGYGIGSWMPQEVIKGMKAEAFMRSQILLTTNMNSDATSLARELQITMNGVKNTQNKQQEIPPPMSPEDAKKFMDRITKYRTDAWKMKIDAYGQLFDSMEQQMKDLTAAASGGQAGMKSTAKGAFSTFANGIESPIDWGLSQIVMKDRSFDSINIDSHYIRIDSTSQNADSSSHSQNIAGSIEASGTSGAVTGSLSVAAAGASASKVTATMTQKNVEATLVLTAFATHRHVKQFDTVHLIPQNVREAWNFFNSGSAIPDPEADMVAFETMYAETLGKGDAGNEAETISLLTEIYQGSALVGMVHFVQHEGTSSSQSSSGSSFSIEAKLKVSQYLDSFTGSTSFSQASASQIASMASEAGLDIEFDLVVIGYQPKVKSQIMKFAVSSFADFDPSKFDAGAIMPDPATSGAQAQGKQQSNMGSVIKSTVQSLNSVEQDNPVLGIQTFMDAFDDFSEACRTDPNIGAPVGMNVRQFNKLDVMKLLAQKYLTRAQANGQTGSASSGTGGGEDGGA